MRAYYTRGPIQTGRTVDLPHARQRYFCIGLRDRVTRLHTHTGAYNYNLLEERGTAEKRWSVAGREEKGDRTSHSFKKHPTDNTHIPGHRIPDSPRSLPVSLRSSIFLLLSLYPRLVLPHPLSLCLYFPGSPALSRSEQNGATATGSRATRGGIAGSNDNIKLVVLAVAAERSCVRTRSRGTGPRRNVEATTPTWKRTAAYAERRLKRGISTVREGPARVEAFVPGSVDRHRHV